MILPLATCMLIFAARSSSPSLLLDSDTKVLLAAIRERNDPLSWFRGDWPLGNHFYRPVSTLTFEVDNALYKSNATGYGITNALIACACVLALFWLIRETLQSNPLAGVASALFGLWHVSLPWAGWATSVTWLLAIVSLIGLFRGSWWQAVLAFLTFAYLGTLFEPSMPFDTRIVAWLPGRTASTMTLFCLVSLACYARYEQTSRRPHSPARVTALDLPATKGSQARLLSNWANGWIALSLVSAAAALASYEQAVMLPAAVLVIFLYFRSGQYKPVLWPVFAHLGVLVTYLAIRVALVPSSPSGYQSQQFRNGGGVAISLMDYLAPACNGFATLTLTLSTSLLILLNIEPWMLISRIAGNVASWFTAIRDRGRSQILAFFALSVLTYLPMAWLQQFGHYHYWPSAARTVYVACLTVAALKMLVTAVSPRALQAPSRPNPAPGSLPRP